MDHCHWWWLMYSPIAPVFGDIFRLTQKSIEQSDCRHITHDLYYYVLGNIAKKLVLCNYECQSRRRRKKINIRGFCINRPYSDSIFVERIDWTQNSWSHFSRVSYLIWSFPLPEEAHHNPVGHSKRILRLCCVAGNEWKWKTAASIHVCCWSI